jgi:hypothetical protein
MMGEICLSAADQIVDDAHNKSMVDQKIDHVTPYKARASGNYGDGLRRHFAPTFFIVRTL